MNTHTHLNLHRRPGSDLKLGPRVRVKEPVPWGTPAVIATDDPALLTCRLANGVIVKISRSAVERIEADDA